jgi:hypothetical protein
MDNLAQFESELWSAADNLRANSKLTSSDYFMPVLGIIFLRHAPNRFDAATQRIADDQAAGRMAPVDEAALGPGHARRPEQTCHFPHRQRVVLQPSLAWLYPWCRPRPAADFHSLKSPSSPRHVEAARRCLLQAKNSPSASAGRARLLKPDAGTAPWPRRRPAKAGGQINKHCLVRTSASTAAKR